MRRGLWITCAALMVVCAGMPASAVVYVNVNNTSGTYNGNSWATAWRTLQEGIDDAVATADLDVWVAAGTYNRGAYKYATGTQETWGNVAVDGSVILKTGVRLYGGFDGTETVTQFSRRAVRQNVTIIDGTNARTTQGGGDAFHVVVVGDQGSAVANVTLDGFTITGGNAAGYNTGNPTTAYHTYRGGGLFNWRSAPTIANCTFVDNEAAVSGGAMANETYGADSANAIIQCCAFYDNYANRGADNAVPPNPVRGGGAMFNNDANAALVYCTFYENALGVYDPGLDTGGLPILNHGVNSAAMLQWKAAPTVDSSILWNEAASPDVIENSNDLGATEGAILQYTDTRNAYTGPSGAGNITNDPWPAAAVPPVPEFHLQVTSPCRNTGNTTYPAPTRDLPGTTPHRQEGRVDMGAYEYCPSGPVAIAKDITIPLTGSPGSVSILPMDVNDGSTSACGIWKPLVSPSTFDCGDVGDNTVTLTVYNYLGQSSSDTCTVTVQDVTDPVAVPNNITVPLDATGQATITADQLDGGSTDNCAVTGWSASRTSFNCGDTGGPVSVTLTVSDDSANTDQTTCQVTVVDPVLPTATCQNITVDVGVAGTYTLAAAEINNGSADACGIASLSIPATTYDCDDVGNTYPVVLTVTDNNSNTDTCTAQVTVADNTPPTAVCNDPYTVSLGANGTYTLTAAELDGGSSDFCGVANLSIPATVFAGADIATSPHAVTLTVTDNHSNTATCVANVTVDDIIAPTVTINQGSTQADPTNVAAIVFDVVFSEPVVGFDDTGNDVEFAFTGTGSLVDYAVAGSGAAYTVTATVAGEGSITATIPAGVCNDYKPNGNQASTSTDNLVLFDVVRPTVTVTCDQDPGPTAVSPLTFRFVFSEDVSGFEATDIVVTLGSRIDATFQATDARNYSIDVTPAGQGSVTVQAPASCAFDGFGNGNYSGLHSITYDSVGPTVAITSSAAPATNVSPIPFRITFNEGVADFIDTDIGATNGTVTAFSPVSATVYDIEVTPLADGAVTVTVDAGVAHDTAGNASQGPSSGSVIYDTDNPGVVVSTTETNPTNANPMNFDVDFDEVVADFGAGSITVVNGSVLSVSPGPGTHYDVQITPAADGDVSVSVEGGKAHDAAGNGNDLSNTVTIRYDGTRPSPTINQAVGQADPTNALPIAFDVDFGEVVTGFDDNNGDDVDVVFGGTAGVTAYTVTDLGGGDYTVAVTAVGGNGTVIPTIPAGICRDTATNLNQASTSSDNSVRYDTVGPTVTVSTTEPAITNSNPMDFDIDFSESVADFASEDITVVNGSVQSVSAGPGTHYDVLITPAADGDVSVSVAVGRAHDAATNPSQASNLVTVKYDGTGPTPTVSTTMGAATNVSPLDFDVDFDESVADFDSLDITVTGGSVASVSPGPGTHYDVSITPGGEGNVVVRLLAGAAHDAQGNASVASNTVTVRYDTVSPTCTVTAPTPDPTNANPMTFLVHFNESVADFLDSEPDVTITNGSLVSISAGPGTDYNVLVSPTADGLVSVSVAAGVAHDAATNPNTASNTASVTYDGTRPNCTVEQAVGQADPAVALPILFDVVFDEPVVGFDDNDGDDVDVIFTGSAIVTAYTITNPSADKMTFVLSVTGTGDGYVVPSVPGTGECTDVAGNWANASTSVDNSVLYDVANPNVVVAKAPAQLNPTNASPVEFRVTFSEAVWNFEDDDSGDVDVDLSGSTATVTGYTIIGGDGDHLFTVRVAVDGASPDGDVVITVPAGVCQDIMANLNTAAPTPATVRYETTPPQVLSVVLNGTPAATDATITFTVTFDEPVKAVDAADFGVIDDGALYVPDPPNTLPSVTGAVVGGTADTWIVTVDTGVIEGTIGLEVLASNDITDLAGNALANVADSGLVHTVDTVAPTVDSVIVQGTPAANAAQLTFVVTFREDVTPANVDADDFAIDATGTITAAPTIDSVSAGADDAEYLVVVNTGTMDGTLSVDVISGDTPAIADVAGNEFVTDYTGGEDFAVDTIAPRVSSIVTGAPALNNFTTLEWTVTFNEDMAQFNAWDDLVVTSAPTLSFTSPVIAPVTAAQYTVTFNNVAGDGTLSFVVDLGSDVIDVAGNALATAGTGAPVTVDQTPPAGSFGATALTPNYGNNKANVNSEIKFLVQFADVHDLTINLTAGDVNVNTSGVGITYSGPFIDSGTVADPDHQRYVVFQNVAGNGQLTVSVDAGTVVDAASNADVVDPLGPAPAVTIDNRGPVVTIGAPSKTIENTGPVTFPITYADAASITLADVDVIVVTTSGTAWGVASVSGTGLTSRTVTLDNLTGNGTLAIMLAANTARDDVMNGHSATALSAPVTVDNIAPDVLAITPEALGPIAATSLDFDIDFSENVKNLDGTDLIVVLIGDLTATTPTVVAKPGRQDAYTATLGNIAGTYGTITLSVSLAKDVTDLADNPLANTLTSAVVTIDLNVLSVMDFTADSTGWWTNIGPTNADHVQFTVQFSAPVLNFDTTDLFWIDDGSTVTYNSLVLAPDAEPLDTYTLHVNDITGDGTLKFNFYYPSSVRDVPGNTLEGIQPSSSVDIDNTPPNCFAIVSDPPSPTNKETVDFTFNFDEPVRSGDIEMADLTISTTGTVFYTTPTLTIATSPETTQCMLRIEGIAGEGLLIAGLTGGVTIRDLAGNPLGSTVPPLEVELVQDYSGPIAQPITRITPTPTNADIVEFRVPFSEAVINVDCNDLIVTRTGTVTFNTAVVSPAGAAQAFTVGITDVAGDGDLRITVNVAHATITDIFGNTLALTVNPPCENVVVDNTPPAMAFTGPVFPDAKADSTTDGPVEYTVTYSDLYFNTASITLAGADIELVNVGGGVKADPTIVVSGTGPYSRTITLSDLAGSTAQPGEVAIRIWRAGTAADFAGNLTPGSDPSEPFTIEGDAGLPVAWWPVAVAMLAVGMVVIRIRRRRVTSR